MKDSRRRKPSKRIYLLILLPIFLIGIYLLYINFLQEDEKEIPQQENTSEEIIEPEETEEEIPQGPLYEELLPVIGQQQAYVVVPTKIDSKNPPTLILYSHGSNTTVTQNMEDQFMKDLQQYGIFFTPHNYIFAASNQHGVNWGNSASIQDTLNLKEWVKENYGIQPKVYLIGFSMGGLPTMNFATTYPDIVEKIALLAPTTKSSTWDKARVEKIMDMDIKVWHGNKDVNVPYSGTVYFLSKIKGLGKDIELITLEGKTHFDIDTEYMGDILQFFSD